jgi:acetylornithine deacetylase/succinyl-diaminopimelate desuccinylase-like protein
VTAAPAELLRQLIRFDTTNPPGNERACVEWVDGLLREAGLETTIVAADPDRPNLVARLPGVGTAPPLLWQGHVDVVTTAGQTWTHPPFEAVEDGGYVWGRGTLDMKSGVAMMLHAILRAAAEGVRPGGDIVLAVLADEEAGGDLGALHLVTERPDLLDGVRYALGEFGGFSQEIAGRRFSPIQVSEKQMCWLRATVRGPGGHGSLPMRGGTMARLAQLLRTLDRRRLPVHVTPVVERQIGAIADELPAPLGAVLRRLLDPRLTDRVLGLLGERGGFFDPLLHNTVNATIVQGGEKVNVIPSEAAVTLDGRLLPGQSPDDLVRELEQLLGTDVEFQVERAEPGPPEPDFGLFDLLAGVLRDADPATTPVPLLLAAITDARHFGRLGIQGYGFTPMQLPADLRFTELIHAADERIPVDAVAFGADAYFRVLERYGR